MSTENTGISAALQKILTGISQVIDAKINLSAVEGQLGTFVEEYNAKRESMILVKWDKIKKRGGGWCEAGRHFVSSKNIIGIHIRERFGRRCGYQGGEVMFDIREEHLTCCKKCFERQKENCHDEQNNDYRPPQHLYYFVDEYDVAAGSEPECKPNFGTDILKRWKIPEHARLDSNFMSHEKYVQIGDKKFSLIPDYSAHKITHEELERGKLI